MAQHLVMVIDMKNCIACSSCAVACKFENNLPNDIWWNHVRTIDDEFVIDPDRKEVPTGIYPNLAMGNITVSCQHCENPACLSVCPTGATQKDDETGIVTIDPEQCIGCKSCIAACPYDVRTYVEHEPQYAVDFALGSTDVPTHKQGVVEKCTFCYHHVKNGDLPACIEPCPARVRYFGDLNDPNSDVSKLIAENDYVQLLPDSGTVPSVYYLR